MKKEILKKGDEILRFQNFKHYIFIILSGEASITRVDFSGNRTIFERLKADSVFSDIFISENLIDFMSIRCLCDCEILFVDYKSLISPCESMCDHHFIFLTNIMDVLVKSSAFYNDRIDILSRRSTREKLLTYFETLAEKNNSIRFSLPFSLSELADYLSVDRSAMMREISKMNSEGIIKSDRRKIVLLQSDR